MRSTLFGGAAALGGAYLVLVTGACIPDAILIGDGPGGSGQGAAGGSATTGAGAGNTSTTSSSMGCTQPSDCPGSDTACRQRTCDMGICDFQLAAMNVPCSENGGQVCDGEGFCVECTVDAHCDEPPCNNKVCGIKFDLGEACESGSDCLSGHCTDGVCCNSACTGTCQACVQSTTCQPDGQCSNVPAGTDPDSECNGGTSCFGGSCQTGKVVFTTSATYTGNMGGLAGADQICANHAALGCLEGTFMAWLSTNQASPSSRFTKATVPYRRVDGVAIASSWTDLVDGALTAPPNLDELGKNAPNSNIPGGCLPDLVYSGTTVNGTALQAATNRCSDWTSTTTDGLWGRFGVSSGNWTEYCNGEGGNTCTLSAAIYCFQQ